MGNSTRKIYAHSLPTLAQKLQSPRLLNCDMQYLKEHMTHMIRETTPPSAYAVIFDMDGLMVDTEPLAQQAWQQVLAAYGQALDEALYTQMIGRRSDQSAQMILAAYPLPLTVTELVQYKMTVFADLRAQGVPVMPGLPELVAALETRHIPWGVATSSPYDHAVEILRQLGLTAVCRAIAAGDEVSHGKPAPDIYLLAANRLGVLPQDCLALEDSAPGCRAALAAGMQAVAIPNGITKMADFSFVPSVFASLHEVVERLDVLIEKRPYNFT